jgi:phospholipid transport system substrate-binding protein
MKYLLLITVVASMAIASPAPAEQPIEVLKKTVNQGLRILDDSTYAKSEAKQDQRRKLWQVLQRAFDFHEFSRLVLAGQWHRFSPPQQSEFVDVFGRFLGRYYLSKLQEMYSDERVVFLGQEFLSESRAVVSARVIWKEQEVPVQIRMLRQSDTWKVYDVIVLGISAVHNYRAQFREILRKETPQQVIERLKTKLMVR